MELTWMTYLIVCPLVFLGGFVDSIAGGGGLISLPAYYMAGLPPVLAAGTNKLSASCGTITSTLRFLKSGKVVLPAALAAAVGAFPGSWLGTNLLQRIPENLVRMMMIVVIPCVAAVVFLRGNKPQKGLVQDAKWTVPVSFCIGLAVGFYDGLVGPGTGTFLIILFSMLLGMDGVMASGTAKVVNLASNLASLTNLLLAGKVLMALGLPVAVFGMLGNYLGASMTIRKGTGFVRSIMLVVLALLLAKMVMDVVS